MSLGQPSDPKEAMKWLKQSAENGYVRAQYQIALCLHQGRVVQTNLLEAVCSLLSCLVEILYICLPCGVFMYIDGCTHS